MYVLLDLNHPEIPWRKFSDSSSFPSEMVKPAAPDGRKSRACGPDNLDAIEFLRRLRALIQVPAHHPDTQNPARGGVSCIWRRGRDSNPREATNLQRFSRPPHSTALPPLRCVPGGSGRGTDSNRWVGPGSAIAIREATTGISSVGTVVSTYDTTATAAGVTIPAGSPPPRRLRAPGRPGRRSRVPGRRDWRVPRGSSRCRGAGA